MVQDMTSRLRRLALLFLLTWTTATAFSADILESEAMPRARHVRYNRARSASRRLVSLHQAECFGGSATTLRGNLPALAVPRGSVLTVPLDLPPRQALPHVRVTLGTSQTLLARWHPRHSSPSLLIILPDDIQADTLTIQTDEGVLWQRYVYILFAPSVSPQAPPWRSVLDDACAWARGAQTEKAIASGLTTGLFRSGRFVYPTDDPIKSTSYVSGETFHLTDFLEHQGPSVGNCVDVSDYLVICARALGVPMKTLQLMDSQERPMITNSLCPIGWDPTDLQSYQTLGWTMHQIAYLPSYGRIYDACFVPLSYTDNIHEGWSLTNISGYWQSWDGNAGLIKMPALSGPKFSSGGQISRVQ
jgi:hypothetical protein